MRERDTSSRDVASGEAIEVRAGFDGSGGGSAVLCRHCSGWSVRGGAETEFVGRDTRAPYAAHLHTKNPLRCIKSHAALTILIC